MRFSEVVYSPANTFIRLRMSALSLRIFVPNGYQVCLKRLFSGSRFLFSLCWHSWWSNPVICFTAPLPQSVNQIRLLWRKGFLCFFLVQPLRVDPVLVPALTLPDLRVFPDPRDFCDRLAYATVLPQKAWASSMPVPQVRPHP